MRKMALVSACAVSALSCVLSSCREAPPPADGDLARSPAERVMVPVQWHRVWMVGGTENDTTLLQPWRLAVGTDLVFALDKGGTRVAAIRKEDGSVAWIRGRKGSGPGEYRLPTALAVDHQDNVWVADALNERIDVLTPAGELRASFSPSEFSYPEAMCPLPGGDMLIATSAREQPILRLSAAGQVVTRMDLPWDDLVGAPPLAVQKLLSPTSDGCVLALVLGRGFAVLSDEPVRTFPYVESWPLPEIESRTESDGSTVQHVVDASVAATSLTSADEQIAVSPEGGGELSRRLVDIYDRGSGAYRHSYTTPVPFDQMERSGSTYYFLTHRDGYPALVAVRPEAGGPGS